jgi:predicted Zn-dependent protease
MRALQRGTDRLGLGALACALLLGMQGCASTGSLMETVGNLSGQKSLAAAGSSFKRSAETQDFSEDEKYYTGRTVGANLLAGEEPSDNVELEAYVGKVGQTLALASGKATLPHGWHFMLLKETEPDAFACPGGLIFISEGLVKLCENEDDLAGVLAHEISHVAIDHPMQAISASNRTAALVSLTQFAYEKSTSGNDAASGMASQFNNVVKDVASGVTHGYDKTKEKEADLSAVKMCIEAGYDPRGLKRVLERLKKGDSTHGDPIQRAKDVEDLAYANEPCPKTLDVRTQRFNKALGRD